MQIELSQDKVYEELLKIKPVKATGPNMVSPKLLKLAGKSIVPSLTSIFHISAQTTWKTQSFLQSIRRTTKQREITIVRFQS